MKTLLFLLLAMACTNVRAAIAVSVNGMCNIYGAGHTPLMIRRISVPMVVASLQ